MVMAAAISDGRSESCKNDDGYAFTMRRVIPGWGPSALNKEALKHLLRDELAVFRDELLGYEKNRVSLRELAEDGAQSCAYQRRAIPVERFFGHGMNNLNEEAKNTS